MFCRYNLIKIFLCGLNLCFITNVCGFNLSDYEQLLNKINMDTLTTGKLDKDFMNNIKKLEELEPNYFHYTPFKSGRISAFQCSVETSIEPATTVHRLRPSDIKVVGALGDSLTAGLGSNAQSILGLLVEYRGRSFSHGGDSYLENLVTMPNIIKKFNPNLKGLSTGINYVFTGKEGKGLNVAVSGSEANNMPLQATRLIQRFKELDDIDFEKDWKLVTLFIGGNDLCSFCNNRELYEPKAYVNFIKIALDILYKGLPRTFVNLVSVLNVSDVKLLNEGLICSLIHKSVCPCAAFPTSLEQENQLNAYLYQYHTLVETLIGSQRYEGREDFTVVLQPFLKDFKIPRLPDGSIDLAFFAPDCFHLSTKGHATAAVGLWNNMLQPVGNKSTSMDIYDTIKCPTQTHPYFFTNINSIKNYEFL